MSNSQLNSFIVEILFAHALNIREISRSPILRWNPRSSKVNFILENIRGQIKAVRGSSCGQKSRDESL